MMSEFVRLNAENGQDLGAYVVRPTSEPVAGLVMVQEIFGVNRHLRFVAAGHAKEGFLARAPELLDRIESGVESDYSRADRQKAMSLLAQLDPENSLFDLAVAIEFATSARGK
jgi:carboxymethylenebutenolidase